MGIASVVFAPMMGVQAVSCASVPQIYEEEYQDNEGIMPMLDNMKCILLAAAPQQVAKPVERAAKDAVKNIEQAVKAPAPKSAVKEAPKVAEKVKSLLETPCFARFGNEFASILCRCKVSCAEHPGRLTNGRSHPGPVCC